MALRFGDLSLKVSDQLKVKLPKGFGASDAVGTVVELMTNNHFGDQSIYLQMLNKKGSAKVVTQNTVSNFLKYIQKDLYNVSIFIDRFLMGLFPLGVLSYCYVQKSSSRSRYFSRILSRSDISCWLLHIRYFVTAKRRQSEKKSPLFWSFVRRHDGRLGARFAA